MLTRTLHFDAPDMERRREACMYLHDLGLEPGFQVHNRLRITVDLDGDLVMSHQHIKDGVESILRRTVEDPKPVDPDIDAC